MRKIFHTYCSEPPERTAWSYNATIAGELCSKSNSRRIVRFGNHPAIIKSQKALDYRASFLAQTRKPETPFTGRVQLDADIFYASERPDLDVALLQDCIQAAGIIKNDRQIREIHAYHQVDKKYPRVEFTLTEMEGL